MEVAKERNGWRDESLSRRHRIWGWDCPALDLDFVLVEYDKGRAKALIEYKYENAAPQFASHPSYKALINLGNRAGVSVFAVRYNNDFSRFKVVPLNRYARFFVPERAEMSEIEYVTLLYKLRGRNIPQDILQELKG